MCNSTVQVNMFHPVVFREADVIYTRIDWHTSKNTKLTWSFKSSRIPGNNMSSPQIVRIELSRKFNENGHPCTGCKFNISVKRLKLKNQIYSTLGLDVFETDHGDMIVQTDLFFQNLEIHVKWLHSNVSWLDMTQMCENESTKMQRLPYFWDARSEMLGMMSLYSLTSEGFLGHPPFVVPYRMLQKNSQVHNKHLNSQMNNNK